MRGALAAPVVKKMPGPDQIEGRVRRTQTTDIDDPNQATLRDQHVARNEIAMSHDISSDTRKLAKRVPQAAEPRSIEELLAVLEAGLHPCIVGMQVSTSARSSERTTEGFD